MPPKNYYSSITYTYTVPPNSAFVELNAHQLASLYEPNVDVVEKLLEYSMMQEAKDLIERIKR